MPAKPDHVAFDKYLRKRGVLLKDAGYDKVHEFMDSGHSLFGAKHRDIDIYHSMEGLRTWLNGKFNVIGQDRATDWLRAGLGHILLDTMESSLDKRYGWNAVLDSAYRSMVQRGWTRAKFVPRLKRKRW